MWDDLKKKCENLMVLLPSNLYLANEAEMIDAFIRLRPPAFLAQRIEHEIRRFSAVHLQAGDLPNPRVLLYQGALRLGYLSFQIEENGVLLAVTCGPLLFERLSTDELRYLAQKMKFSGENRLMFQTYIGIVPFYGREALDRLAGVLTAYFRAGLQKPEFLSEEHAFESERAFAAIGEKFEERNFVAENYALEGVFLRAVEHGDAEFIRASMRTGGRPVNIPPRYPGDPLREAKNLSITANSITLRAAIKGGLDTSLAHSISHTIAVRIEQQTSSETLWQLLPEIALTYAQAVRDYALKDHSDLIVRVINYIRRNLGSPIGLRDVANELHISREYLCRRFAGEMHSTLTDYIHRSKVKESCPLLAARKYDVSEIAALFGYSSSSHYAKTFKKVTGVSPSAWQAIHGAH